MLCGRCDGSGAGIVDGARVDCDRCKGEGVVVLDRCASFYQEPWMFDFFDAYSRLESGILPDGGGFEDQTSDFVHITRAIGAQVSECEREQKREHGRAAEAKQRALEKAEREKLNGGRAR